MCRRYRTAEMSEYLSTERPWADLPEDILYLIIQRLYILDRVHFRAVCKNWRLPPCFDKLPWIFHYVFSQHEYSLPTHRTRYSLSEPYYHCNKPTFFIDEEVESDWLEDDETGHFSPAGSFFFRAKPCASRSGWVLFSEIISKKVDHSSVLSCLSFSWFSSTSLYYGRRYHAYNPHTKAVISLPSLSMPKYVDFFCETLVTFTSTPTSPDCEFVVLSELGNCLWVSTYSIGDETWKTRYIPYRPPCHDVEFMGRSFYFYNGPASGLLLSLDIDTEKWTLHSENPSPNILKIQSSIARQISHYFLAYGGHLHLVYLLLMKKVDVPPRCHVFRFDWVNKDWKRMESLEGGALFLGRPLYFRELSFGVSASEETEMVANRVYYLSCNVAKPCFLVYGPSEEEEDNNSQSSQSKINYHYSWNWHWFLKGGFGTRRNGTWMQP